MRRKKTRPCVMALVADLEMGARHRRELGGGDARRRPAAGRPGTREEGVAARSFHQVQGGIDDSKGSTASEARSEPQPSGGGGAGYAGAVPARLRPPGPSGRRGAADGGEHVGTLRQHRDPRAGAERCERLRDTGAGRRDRLDQQLAQHGLGEAVRVEQDARAPVRLAEVLDHPLVDRKEAGVREPLLEGARAGGFAQQPLEGRAADRLPRARRRAGSRRPAGPRRRPPRCP